MQPGSRNSPSRGNALGALHGRRASEIPLDQEAQRADDHQAHVCKGEHEIFHNSQTSGPSPTARL